MAKTQTVILHITVNDDDDPLCWNWDEQFDLVVVEKKDNEFHLMDSQLFEETVILPAVAKAIEENPEAWTRTSR